MEVAEIQRMEIWEDVGDPLAKVGVWLHVIKAFWL